MRDGFVKVASVTPKIKVANPEYNRIQSVQIVKEAAKLGAKVIVLDVDLHLTKYLELQKEHLKEHMMQQQF